MKSVGVALGGGGAKGLCHIAFLKALDELGIQPSIIAGTSIGALLGGFYAAGMSGADIEAEVENLNLADVDKIFDLSIFSGAAIFESKGVAKFLGVHLPAHTFEALQIPLQVVATDFWKRKQVVFRTGELIPAIQASISLPAVFEPVVIDDMVLLDGGAVNPLPYDLIRDDCEVLIAIDVSGEKTPPTSNPIPGMFESTMSTFQIMMASIVNTKMQITQPDIYIKPALQNIRVLEFYRYKEIMTSIAEDVQQFKKQLEALLK
jgi:NTE family protein